MSESTLWKDKIAQAEKYYKTWADKFKCDALEEYYENHQWRISDTSRETPYIVNLVYSTIETKLANMLLQSPKFDVTARPQFSDWDQETAYASAMLKQDTINTLIENPELCFNDTIRLAALDSYFRFAVVEIGYAADWQNPHKAPPHMKSDDMEPAFNLNKDKVVEEFDIPTSEQLYFRWIPARRFRVAVADSPFLKNCNWCGYYSYFYTDILKRTKGISFKEVELDVMNSVLSPEYGGPLKGYASKGQDKDKDAELQYLIKNNALTKCWTIWDNKTKTKKLVHDDSGTVIWQDDFDYIPLATYRHNHRLNGWYPVPPVFYWLSPQNEVNEAREQMRNYRKRFKRKWWVLKSKIDAPEIDKLSSDVDGETIIVKERDAIGGIPNAEIGVSITESLALGYNDFNHVSGSSQVREGDRETATKSKIISLKEQVRENVERQRFDGFVCEVGRLGLKVAAERFTLPMWIKYSTDPSDQFLAEVQAKGPAFRQIQATQLDDGYDFLLKLNVVDGSDVQMQAEAQKLISFLGIVNQFPQVMMSPTLIREAAYKVGYKNEKVIRDMQRTALLFVMGQAAQANAATGGNSAGLNNENAAKNATNNAAPNPVDEMSQQLFQQV